MEGLGSMDGWSMRRRYCLPAVVIAVSLLVSGCSQDPAKLPGEQIAVIGDSYTTGLSDNPADPNVWPAMVWQDLRDRGYGIDPTVAGEGGAGYANPGYRGGTFADKARQAVRRYSDVIVFFGSANDIDAPADAVPEAVRATLKDARRTAPEAKLLVIGPAWPRPDPPPEVWRVRDAVRDEATGAGATFVDPLEQRWLWDDPALIGPDKIHPDPAGQKYLAEKIGPLIEAQLPAPHSDSD